MERLNSRLRKLKSKKGFTLIELLAVIAIIAILVLIAAPSFLGSKEKAVLAAVKADIKTAELAVGRHLLDHETLAKQTVNGKEVGFDKYTPESGKDYYNVNGKIDTPVGGELYDISKVIDSKVLDKGDLVASDNGKVYFVTDEGKLKNPGKGNSSTGGDNSGNNSGGDTGNGSDTGNGTGGSTGNGSNTGNGTGGSTGGTPGTGGEKEPEVKPEPNPESDFGWITNQSIGYDFPGQSGKGYWHYKGKAKEVVIPEKLGGHTLKSYNYMFKETSVTKVTSTNKEVTSMYDMFRGSKATSLDLSSLDTSNVTNMQSMFYQSQAKSLDLSNFNTSSVTNMAYMFTQSQATSIIGLDDFDTSNVTEMGSMFASSRAKSLDLSNFNTSNVTIIGAMFSGSQATTLDLSSFDTSNLEVRDMYGMFRESKATTGYAKTQADAYKFNSSNSKPSGLTFTVKK